ncbi:MAG: MerR family transcriptional regulator [Tissierellia bacterium]|nr:MerR family transcriptional regulator [Tissierellia bacterium]
MLDVNKEYTISEVAEITGYAPHVLRYYEKEFDIDIPRNNSNHRYYTYKEIELILYIKSLQEKGFSNKQIKLILASPEIMMNNQEAMAGELVSLNNKPYLDTYQLAREISTSLGEEFFQKLQSCLDNNRETNTKIIEELKEEIIMLRNELNSKERDVLICENAKLKMKIKEKTFENIELREKLKKAEEKNGGFLKRIFS